LRRLRGGRPETSVAILAPSKDAGAAKATELLVKFGLGVAQIHGIDGPAVTVWLREQEAQGIELLLVFAPLDTRVAHQTCLPVITLPAAESPGATVAATPAEAAWLAARILGLKYPDVQARLQLAELEMTETPGKSRVSPVSSRTSSPR
jgi:phosphoribosylcarboxyaminoimidazole (NCAIR) mutase